MKVDSILHLEEIYLNRNIFKEYDIPKLTSEKKEILKAMKGNKTLFHRIIITISTILLITLIFLFYQNNKKKIYKNRFEEIISNNKKATIETNPSKEINIPTEIIDNVLEGLKNFEENQMFTLQKITLNSLAKELNTNTNYLSKIINHYKKNTFSNYLNTLRVTYIINKLKTDKTIRKYTIKAISEEAGFYNSESFSKAFHKIKGIKPSYFLKELKKIDKKY